MITGFTIVSDRPAFLQTMKIKGFKQKKLSFHLYIYDISVKQEKWLTVSYKTKNWATIKMKLQTFHPRKRQNTLVFLSQCIQFSHFKKHFHLPFHSSCFLIMLPPFIFCNHPYSLSLMYTVYSIPMHSVSNNEEWSMLCHCLSSSFVTKNDSWVCWHVRFNVFSFGCPGWKDETLLNYDKWCFVNLLSFATAELCSCWLALSNFFLPSSTAANIFCCVCSVL